MVEILDLENYQNAINCSLAQGLPAQLISSKSICTFGDIGLTDEYNNKEAKI